MCGVDCLNFLAVKNKNVEDTYTAWRMKKKKQQKSEIYQRLMLISKLFITINVCEVYVLLYVHDNVLVFLYSA